jgi:S-adenosylmethionine:tRNA ribosyltransferase-isomerase
MKTADFSFNLPERLIAQAPSERRGGSRLMVLDRSRGVRSHHTVEDLPGLLAPGSLLVFNDSRVRKARLIGRSSETGAQAAFLLLKALDPCTWQALGRRPKRRSGFYVFDAGAASDCRTAEVAARDPGTEYRIMRFDRPIDEAWLERCGHVPLPPYIRREDRAVDNERYQTVYARGAGSAAAPTAGLHFSAPLLAALADQGVETAFVTLHVGLGTFLPVRCERLEDHRMHSEAYIIEEDAARRISRARLEGRPITAVGTTSLRALESAWVAGSEGGPGRLRAGSGETSIFIYPGYAFKAVDALFTNFHTPQSSLLMLVCAFAGRSLILDSYAEAARLEYRFFSYGDAMLIR